MPVTVSYGDQTWTQVGFRYKGNSSLRSAWQQGILKLSFRFDFDRYEAEYPELDDQRFWGFSKMTFSNGFNDPSLMRDKLGADTTDYADVQALITAINAPAADAAAWRADLEAAFDVDGFLNAPYVVGPEGSETAPYTFLASPASFDNSLTDAATGLLPHLQKRRTAVVNALATP